MAGDLVTGEMEGGLTVGWLVDMVGGAMVSLWTQTRLFAAGS